MPTTDHPTRAEAAVRLPATVATRVVTHVVTLVAVRAMVRLATATARRRRPRRAAGPAPRPAAERGQGTVEYALVLLGAAAVALLLVAWVARTDLVGRLFDTVVGKILRKA